MGLTILEDIRRDFKAEDLSIIIYSQRGLFLLDDEKMRLFDDLDAHWLIKQQYEPVTERTRMNRIMRDDKKVGSLRKKWVASFSLCFAAMIAAFYVFPQNSVPWHIMAGIPVAIMAGIVIRACEKQVGLQA